MACDRDSCEGFGERLFCLTATGPLNTKVVTLLNPIHWVGASFIVVVGLLPALIGSIGANLRKKRIKSIFFDLLPGVTECERSGDC
jgi:hypothetical protein